MAEAPTSNLRSLSHSTSPASNPQKGEPCTGIVQLAEGEKRPRNMSHWILWFSGNSSLHIPYSRGQPKQEKGKQFCPEKQQRDLYGNNSFTPCS